jgi:hypothetical protein
MHKLQKMMKEIRNIRSRLMQTVREAVEKENGCIGTFYRNKGCRYYSSPVLEEYDENPVVVARIPGIDTYGSFIAASVFDLYQDTELRLMCTLNDDAGEDWEEPLEHIQIEGLVCIVDWLKENGFVNEENIR